MADNMTAAQRSRTMSRIRSKNTAPEMVIRRLLFARGFRYRLHSKKLPGCPDLVFPGSRIVVFIDGDFWHGFNWADVEFKLSSYWRDKISRNMVRDKHCDQQLKALGWLVIRRWEHQVMKSPGQCADIIESAMKIQGRDQRTVHIE